MITLTGKKISEGIAIGKLTFYKRDIKEIKRIYVKDVEKEIQRYKKAREKAIAELELVYDLSVREVGEALGLKSPSTVHFHIKHLQEMGLIEKSAGKGRAITLKKQLQAVPVAPQPVEIDELAPRRRQVPILGNVAAGNPILAQECIEDYLTFDTGGHDDEYFALRVRGESMLGVGILPDDLVVVHRQNLAQNGQIVVALLGDEATVKTLKRKGSEVWLMPANPDYQPIDGRECTILARVVAVVRQY